jgi:hypothetical protein
LLKKVLDNPDIHIGLDAAIGKDKCVEVTYCIRNNDEVLTIETLHIKEIK